MKETQFHSLQETLQEKNFVHPSYYLKEMQKKTKGNYKSTSIKEAKKLTK